MPEVNGYRVTCPQCGAFVMNFAGAGFKVETNCHKCKSIILVEKTLDSVSVVAARAEKKKAT